VGPGKAKELLLQDRINARQAQEFHMVEDVVARETLDTRVLEMIHQYNALPAQTLFGVKRLVNFKFDELKTYLEYETE